MTTSWRTRGFDVVSTTNCTARTKEAATVTVVALTPPTPDADADVDVDTKDVSSDALARVAAQPLLFARMCASNSSSGSKRRRRSSRASLYWPADDDDANADVNEPRRDTARDAIRET
jgi:hypothetical protein